MRDLATHLDARLEEYELTSLVLNPDHRDCYHQKIKMIKEGEKTNTNLDPQNQTHAPYYNTKHQRTGEYENVVKQYIYITEHQTCTQIIQLLWNSLTDEYEKLKDVREIEHENLNFSKVYLSTNCNSKGSKINDFMLVTPDRQEEKYKAYQKHIRPQICSGGKVPISKVSGLAPKRSLHKSLINNLLFPALKIQSEIHKIKSKKITNNLKNQEKT